MKVSLSMLVAMALVLTASVAMAGTPSGAGIEGTYIESRSCDVFTAACFANAEIGVTGEEAIMAWDVSQGSFGGVDLQGLSVIAIVRASATLGDTTQSAYPAKSIIIVDAKANSTQREALTEFARESAGELLADVIRVEEAEISMSVDLEHMGHAKLQAGDAVAIETRAMHHHDMHCGNDEAFYGPLTKMDEAVVAFAEHDMFTKQGLGVTWNESGRRSAWVGTFSR